MNDPTLLHTTAASLLTVIEDAVAGVFAYDQSCVTVGEPGFTCDSIHVWPSLLSVVQDDCQAAQIQVQLSWAIAVCTGTDRDEECDWWNSIAPGAHAVVWQAWVGIIDAWTDGTLCGVECNNVTIGPVSPFTDGGIAAWIGTVTLDVAPTLAAS